MLESFDPSKYQLGNICKHGHDWNQTGQSLRYNTDRACVLCRCPNYDHPRHISFEQRFWSRVNKCSSSSGCWLWSRQRDQLGHGKIKQGQTSLMAHRVAWELTNGKIPDGMQVLHHCDNPSCVNPCHLFLGTNADNVADKVAKNRQAQGKKHSACMRETLQQYCERIPRGEQRGTAKLTAPQVLALRKEQQEGKTQRFLAQKYGLSQPTVWAILNRKTWTHI